MDQNPWLTLVTIWRNALLVFLRSPLLILGCLLFYTLLSGYWHHYLPFDVPRGFASQAGYLFLHGLAFGPLVVAVIQDSLCKPRRRNIWTVSVLWVGAAIVLREIAAYGLTVLFHAARDAIAQPMVAEGYSRARYVRLGLLYWFSYLCLALTIFLLSVRLILLLPILALEDLNWREALSSAWKAMRGNYVLALTVSFAALLPMIVTDRFLGRLYRSLSMPDNLPVRLSYREWEALMTRSAELTLDYILIAALAAGLYQTIRSRLPATTQLPRQVPGRRSAA